jgi:hypothetical protein
MKPAEEWREIYIYRVLLEKSEAQRNHLEEVGVCGK